MTSVMAVFLLLFSLLLLSQKATAAATFDYVPRPEFAESGPELNVTSYLSQTSRIPCRVRHLGNKKVSWIRGRDLQVISSGRTKFISDIRVSILPGAGSKRFEKRGVNRVTAGPFATRIRFTDEPEVSSEFSEAPEDADAFWRPSHLLTKDLSKDFPENRGLRKGCSKRGRPRRNAESKHSELHGTHALHSHSHPYHPFEEGGGGVPDLYESSHRKKIKKRIKESDFQSMKDFNDFSYDYVNDYFADESSAPYNESIQHKTTQNESVQSPSSAERLKSTFFQKTPSKKLYRSKNEILNPAEISAKIENPDGVLKNPIFIRPLESLSDLKEPLKPRHIQVPYNYLDAFWEPEDFTLQIKYTRASDVGTYLCQINTEPRMTQIVHLRVVEMIAKVEGPRELFVKEGSPVILTCRITHGDELPGFIFWYKNDLLVDYDSTKGRIEVDMSIKGQSQLILKGADRTDSANYTCAPSGGKHDVVTLTVIAEKHPEAVQQSDGCSPGSSEANWRLCLLLPSVVLLLTKPHQRKKGRQSLS